MKNKNRRDFLKQSLAGSAGVLTGLALLESCGEGDKRSSMRPIVISTWDFGRQANAAAWDILGSGGYALDAVEAGVKITEADPAAQSVGYGGLPDRDGRVTLDACVMDEQYRCGAVLCLEHIIHPVSVARLVMEKTPHIMLSGEGALQFALANGFKKQNLLTPESEAAWKEWLRTANYAPVKNIENQTGDQTAIPVPGGPDNHDTIGMLALDAAGKMSGACTTSGLAYKMHGRVGDSPIIGAGLYVDREVGAATATGVGEEVVRIVGAYLVVELMRQGKKPGEACRLAIERIVDRNPEKTKDMQIGMLALGKDGEYGAFALQKGFTYAVRTGEVDEVFEAESKY